MRDAIEKHGLVELWSVVRDEDGTRLNKGEESNSATLFMILAGGKTYTISFCPNCGTKLRTDGGQS